MHFDIHHSLPYKKKRFVNVNVILVLIERSNTKKILGSHGPRMFRIRDNLEMVSDDGNVLKKVITGDESWVYAYDPEIKQQSSQWKRPDEPRPKKARQSRSHVKSMLIIFFDCEGVVHYEFAPRGQTINKEYYDEVLKRLRDAVRRKRPRFWSSGDSLLHHGNAPAHLSNLVQQFLAKNKIVRLRQPPYSPDIAPCDFWMFPKLKMALKGNPGKSFGLKFIRRQSDSFRFIPKSVSAPIRTHLNQSEKSFQSRLM